MFTVFVSVIVILVLFVVDLFCPNVFVIIKIKLSISKLSVSFYVNCECFAKTCIWGIKMDMTNKGIQDKVIYSHSKGYSVIQYIKKPFVNKL